MKKNKRSKSRKKTRKKAKRKRRNARTRKKRSIQKIMRKRMQVPTRLKSKPNHKRAKVPLRKVEIKTWLF